MNPDGPGPERLRTNIKCIQVMSFTWMFMLIMPVVVPYLEGYGLGIDRVFQLQAIFAITIVLLEVPSGYASDLLGRRGCLLAAGLLHGVAFTVLALADSFGGFVVFELLAALAVCLYSGTDVALLYDTLEAMGDQTIRGRILGHRLMWMQCGETGAALLTAAMMSPYLMGASLAAVSLSNAVIGWVPLAVALFLVEVPRKKMGRRHWHNARTIAHGLFRESAVLKSVTINLILYGLATLIAVWAFQDYWKHMEIGLANFGLLWAAYNLSVALVGRTAHRVESRIGAQRTMLAIGLLPILGYAGMAGCALAADGSLVWAALGVAFGFCFQAGRGFTQVILKDALNARVPAEWRATANSISSMGVRLSFFVLGPALGWLIEHFGHPIALSSYSLLFTVVFLTFNRSLRVHLRGVWEMGYPGGGNET